MKLESITLSKIIIYLMALAVLSILAILLPELAREEKVSNPNVSPAYPYIIAAWIFSIPIFIALYQTLNLVKYIADNTAFSNKAVRSISNIKKCAILFINLIIVGGISVIYIAKSNDPTEDVTGICMLGFITVLATSIIATFAAVLEKLLQNALDMKSENEFTV